MNAEWFRTHLPRWLLHEGPLDMEHWQWLGLAAALLLAWIAGKIVGRLTSGVLRRAVARTSATWDDEIVRRLGGPFTFAWAIAILWVARATLDLPAGVDRALTRGLRVALLVGFVWALFRSVDVLAAAFGRSRWAQGNAASRSLVPLGGRVVKALLFAMGAIMMVAELGYPVGSLIAGLGVGGIALALASQKTVENLFGAFSIGVDQPFRVGDFIKLEGTMGTVEMLGLRSTRIRTLDRTLVTIPNSKLSEMSTESFAVRDRIRFTCDVRLEYATTAAQMRQVLEGLARVLKEQPKLWPESYTVRFKELGESSLNVEVMAWFATSDWNEFMVIREEVLLAFMDVVEKAGTAFALPSQTVHVRQAHAA